MQSISPITHQQDSIHLQEGREWTPEERQKIKTATFFMSLPRSAHLSYEALIAFLRSKDLNDDMIEEAFRQHRKLQEQALEQRHQSANSIHDGSVSTNSRKTY